MNKNVIIAGSSRKQGNTGNVIEVLRKYLDFDIIDLNDFNFSYYDYEHQNKEDDFLPLIRRIIDNYDNLIFVTPVYWYAMSGIMKTFFDRFTDLLDSEYELGRQLQQKSMAVISSSAGNHLGDHFWLPFIETAGYLGMNYIGHIHTIERIDNEVLLKEFGEKIKAG